MEDCITIGLCPGWDILLEVSYILIEACRLCVFFVRYLHYDRDYSRLNTFRGIINIEGALKFPPEALGGEATA